MPHRRAAGKELTDLRLNAKKPGSLRLPGLPVYLLLKLARIAPAGG